MLETLPLLLPILYEYSRVSPLFPRLRRNFGCLAGRATEKTVFHPSGIEGRARGTSCARLCNDFPWLNRRAWSVARRGFSRCGAFVNGARGLRACYPVAWRGSTRVYLHTGEFTRPHACGTHTAISYREVSVTGQTSPIRFFVFLNLGSSPMSQK